MPPSACDNAIELCWLRSDDSGGLSDLHYNVYVASNDTQLFTKANTDPIRDTCYKVPNPDAKSSNTLVVVAANGATSDPNDFTAENITMVQDRFVLFFVPPGDEITTNGGDDGGKSFIFEFVSFRTIYLLSPLPLFILR